MMLKASLLSVVIAVGLSRADPPTPSLPVQFEASVQYTLVYEGQTTVAFGSMWYNLAANALRQDYPVIEDGQNVTFTYLELPSSQGPDQGDIYYIWMTKKPQCSVMSLSGAFTVDLFGWVQGSSFSGSATVDNTKCWMWNSTDSLVPETVWVDQKTNSIPVQLFEGGLGTDSNTYLFLSLNSTAPPSSIFIPPKFCTVNQSREAKPTFRRQLRKLFTNG